MEHGHKDDGVIICLEEVLYTDHWIANESNTNTGEALEISKY